MYLNRPYPLIIVIALILILILLTQKPNADLIIKSIVLVSPEIPICVHKIKSRAFISTVLGQPRAQTTENATKLIIFILIDI